MTTFQEKYLKYKTKYLVLKNNLNNQDNDYDLSASPVINDLQSGGASNNILDISNLTDTPTMDNIQSGGDNTLETNNTPVINTLSVNDSNDILEVSNLTDTPVMLENPQDGGYKKKGKKNKEKLKTINSSSSDNSNLSTEKSGNLSDDSNVSTEKNGGKSKKLIKSVDDSPDSSSDSSSSNSSSSLSLSDSSDSLLSALEDSD